MDVSKAFPHMAEPIAAVDAEALVLILARRAAAIRTCAFHPRCLIQVLKNDPDHLKWLLQLLVDEDGQVYIGAGSYFFTDLVPETAHTTIDLYHEFNLGPITSNL